MVTQRQSQSSLSLTNWKIAIAYDGAPYEGYQIQTTATTVAGELDRALAQIFEKTIKVISAGRTDSGVHAEGQVISFSTKLDIPEDALFKALNSLLPNTIRVIFVEKTESSFCARRSALWREYNYIIAQDLPSIYLSHRSYFDRRLTFDIQKWNDLASLLIGTHDFQCFKNSGSQCGSSIRTLMRSEFSLRTVTDLYNPENTTQVLVYCVRGNSFLYRMVRNLVGAMCVVMRGESSRDNFEKMLHSNERVYRYSPAPAHALSLVRVGYEGDS